MKGIDSSEGEAYNKPLPNLQRVTPMKLDPNKKILMVVVLVLYVLYKMMGG